MTPKLIFLFPGNASSGIQWIQAHIAMINLQRAGFDVILRHSVGCNIYGVRNKCIATKNAKKNQVAFEGTPFENYDRIVWVDSDNHITADKIIQLYNHDVDVAAAWYRMHNLTGTLGDDSLCACGWKDIECFNDEDKKLMRIPLKKHAFHPIRYKEMMTIPRDDKGLIEVDYAGMGLMLVKKKVMDSIEYPWFMSWVFEWEQGGVPMAEIVTDDDGFCFRVKEAGFKIYIDPECRIDHEKPVLV